MITLKSAVITFLVVAGLITMVLLLPSSEEKKTEINEQFWDELVSIDSGETNQLISDNCNFARRQNSDPLNKLLSYRQGFTPSVFGVTWGLPADNYQIERIDINCRHIFDEQSNLLIDLEVFFPVTRGEEYGEINKQTRKDVSAIISHYHDKAIKGWGYTRTHPTTKKLTITVWGFATFQNSGIYSMLIDSVAYNSVGESIFDNQLLTRNYDLETGEEIYLKDLLIDDQTAYEAILNFVIEEFNKRKNTERVANEYSKGGPVFSSEWVFLHAKKWKDEVRDEEFGKQSFTLTKDSLALNCTLFCTKGIMKNFMHYDDAYQIPYRDLEQYLDKDGPYGHIRGEREQFFLDESIVFETISQISDDVEKCNVRHKLNSDERDRFNWHERTHGNTWGLPHDDNLLRRVVIDCAIKEPLTGDEWDKWGMYYDLEIRYPIVNGDNTKFLNDSVRKEVAGMISDYIKNVHERTGYGISSGFKEAGAPERVRKGSLSIYGFTSFSNEGIYSVHLESAAHDPGANTSPDYLRTINIDLETGERFFLDDLLIPGPESFRALQIAAVEDHNFHYLAGKERGIHIRNCCEIDLDFFDQERVPYSIETLREQQFSLTEDAITLDCLSYCDNGIAPNIMFKNNALEVKFDEIAEHLNPDGPIRHFSL